MSTGTKYLLGGAAAAIIAFILLPNWLALGVAGPPNSATGGR